MMVSIQERPQDDCQWEGLDVANELRAQSHAAVECTQRQHYDHDNITAAEPSSTLAILD